MKCDAIVKGKECNKPAVNNGFVLTRNDGLVNVYACEKHRKRMGFFEDKDLEKRNNNDNTLR